MPELDDYVWLTSGAADSWLERLSTDSRPLHQRASALRKELSADRTRLLLQQAELRPQAAAKFGPLATQLFYTPSLLEQASDLWIGRYVAQRFANASQVIDYCCGLGGDLLALAHTGLLRGPELEAWDLDPLACLLAGANLNAIDPGVAAAVRFFPRDVAETAPASEAFWRIDPARRSVGRRSTRPAAHSPPESVFLPWLRQAPHAAIKLSPAAQLSDAWPGELQLEWISRDRQCRQLLVTSGGCVAAGGPRRATRVETASSPTAPPASVSFAGEPDVPLEAASAPEGRLWEPDPSIIAARLTGALAAAAGLRCLGPGSVYLTGDAGVAVPLLTEFEVVESLPLRAATVAKWLAARGIGRVEVKCRGVDLDPDQFARRLRLPAGGEGRGTVFLTRIGTQRLAIVTRRVVR